MCLATISKRKPAKTGFGWKVFIRTDDPKVLRGSVLCAEHLVGKWLTAENSMLKTDTAPHMSYLSGFHIFKTLEGAREYQWHFPGEAIHRVQYTHARLQGEGSAFCKNDRQVIADRIKILAEVK